MGSQNVGPVQTADHITLTLASNEIDNQITNFIQGIRIQGEGEQSQHHGSADPGDCDGNDGRNDKEFDSLMADANRKTDKMIIEAEKFRESVITPPGMGIIGPAGLVATNAMGAIDTDDQFFHVTCHVDPNMKSKIERGEFVELEKLLPKLKGS